MAKKHKHEEHENHERWVVSYADFMTLLFAFFVVMYASSRVDTNKLVETSESMRWALNFKGNGGINRLSIFKGPPTEGGCSANIGAQPHSMSVQKEFIETMRKKLERSLRPFTLARTKNPTVALEVTDGALRLRLAAHRFFDAGGASLRPESLAVLDAIGAELADNQRGRIQIEGHTDDEPIRSTRYRNNWELSASRAATVVSFLEQAHDIASNRLTAAGLGSTRPLVSNDTPEHRELNRRIEIVIQVAPNDLRASATSGQ